MNMLLVALYPGPKTLNPEQAQSLFKPVVDELIEGYKLGFLIEMYLFPEGKYLCLALFLVF